MKRIVRMVVSALVVLAGCQPPDPGGGGGLGNVDFKEGLVFLRANDRNVYISDKSDFTTFARLTTHAQSKHPSISWDGTKVVYVRTDTGAIETVSTTTGAPPVTVYTADAAHTKPSNPVFSPNGNAIAFAYYDVTSAQWRVATVPVSGGTPTDVATSPATSYGSPSYDQSGNLYVASGSVGTSATGWTQLAKVAAAGGALTTVTNTFGSQANSVVTRIIASADGAKFVFDGRQSGSTVRIFVFTAGGGTARITNYASGDSATDSYPSWAGTGSIAFSSDSGGNDNAYTVAATATDTTGSLKIGSAIEPWYGIKP